MTSFITVNDAIKAKRQELRNVRSMITRCAKVVSRRLHKKFVKAGGCKMCWGTGSGCISTENVNALCKCTHESRENSGIDPMLSRASYDNIDDYRWYIPSLGNGHTIDNPIKCDPAFIVMTRELYEKKFEIEQDLVMLKEKKKFVSGDHVIVTPRRVFECGACNYGHNRFSATSHSYVPTGTVLQVEYARPSRSYSYCVGRYVTTVWCKDEAGVTYRLLGSDLKKLLNYKFSIDVSDFTQVQ